MTEKHPQPRWGLLYLVLPLAGALFWLIQRARPSGIVRDSLDLAALLIVFGYVEVWHKGSQVALLHHPLTDGARGPICYVRESFDGSASELEQDGQPFIVTAQYAGLFSVPVHVVEPADEEEIEPLQGFATGTCRNPHENARSA